MMKQFLKMHSGDSWITIQMYLMSLNWKYCYVYFITITKKRIFSCQCQGDIFIFSYPCVFVSSSVALEPQSLTLYFLSSYFLASPAQTDVVGETLVYLAIAGATVTGYGHSYLTQEDCFYLISFSFTGSYPSKLSKHLMKPGASW